MIRSLWSAATGMQAQQLKLDVIANNLANVNTAGFKKSRPDFQDLMYQKLKLAGALNGEGSQVPVGMEIGLGVRPVSVEKIFTQGEYEQTNNELDLAIEGRGFFKVIVNGEEFYTRAGQFKIDRDGYIVTPDGYKLQPEITVPQGTVRLEITQDGQVTAVMGDGTTQNLGQILLYDFPNPAGLYAMGRNLLQATDAAGDVIEGTPGSEGFGTIAQGYLEMSNVDVVEEMVQMIVTQRAYEANSKTIQTADSLLEMANNVKR
ncbi:flagellar basal-body rod protein FlgG [Thermodesulfatator indicus DSM 15286]|uniref:Flagellar basal-body rod protein FlgG n=1 Tax=Thermodesulfatator indicus (strain DSM 15286 / JCM 11887 / CIR29812) TaxID=667014 RepID=F8A871_THEID|nr:flagellar basal-body rod protein FlgG [Thermodesulfatator indicus]AEH44347.1 flagellar basal-body rod protein FlgG [Thermodesulfatator indicus DSM 15286]